MSQKVQESIYSSICSDGGIIRPISNHWGTKANYLVRLRDRVSGSKIQSSQCQCSGSMGLPSFNIKQILNLGYEIVVRESGCGVQRTRLRVAGL